jgi:opacity protein-like surface antigen
MDRTLIYATGGRAWSGAEVTTSSSVSGGGGGGPQVVTDHVTVGGWTVGGGIETSLWGNWTGKLEYQFIRNDEVTVQSQGGPTPHVRTELQTVRIGVNYLFR